MQGSAPLRDRPSYTENPSDDDFHGDAADADADDNDDNDDDEEDNNDDGLQDQCGQKEVPRRLQIYRKNRPNRILFLVTICSCIYRC